ncbi:hypothetical protein N231010_009 [Synechococcus phage S-CAM4]|uniref:Uncharacterized protein n=1 Tax=Synechococcus phage S-CAM4 TaxID=1883367 RepID=A0A1D8KM27_9CAUD|nr:hypothetical protein N231010_009 [Synechococcus phage S-CAM4]
MAHGYASYQDNRGNVDYLGGVVDAVKKYLDNRDKKEKTADMVAAKVNILDEQKTLSGGKTNLLSGGRDTNVSEIPLQKMLGGSSLQRSLPGASAVNPDVVGGAATPGVSRRRGITGEGYFGDSIVDIGATNLGVERDLGGGDMFTKRLDTFGDSGGGSEEVVQAIDRLTFVTMSLVSATKEQSNQQKMIAGAQRQQTDKLARKSKAAAEESALENGQDLSSNSAYTGLLRAATGAMSGAGGSRRGGGPGMGLGGKVLAKNMLKGAAKRGAGRTGARLGIALGGKLAGGFGARMGAKLGAQTVGKVAGGALAKSLGKKIPLVGLGLGAVFAAQRAMQGDFLGAGLELASGAASTVPGIGTAGSVGIDAALAARDMGAVPFADGGIISDATLGLVGEKGKEGVFPLEGAEGRKTFLMFGEGILEAQYKNKNKYAKLQAQGLSQYYDKQNGWEKFVDALKNLLKNLIPGGGGDDNIFARLARYLTGGGGGLGRPVDAPDLKTAIRQLESGNDYGSMYSRDRATFSRGQEDITKMTIDEVDQLQTEYLNHQASKGYGEDQRSAAMGAYQMIEVKKVAKNMGLDTSKVLFNKETQDLMSNSWLNDAGYQEWKAGKITDAVFNDRLAGVFASVKKTSGVGVYDGDGMNTAYGNIMPLLEKLKKEASNPDPDPQPDPPDGGPLTLDPSEIPGANATPEEMAEYEEKLAAIAKRQAAALKAKQAAAATTGGDWAKSLNLGNAPFIDFGSDNQFRAIKRDSGGYTIMKKGFLGGMTRMETKDENLGLKDQLIEAAKPKEISSLAPGSTADPNALGIRSQELALASAGNITTINNITNMSPGANTGGNAPADIPVGVGSTDMGTIIYAFQEAKFS